MVRFGLGLLMLLLHVMVHLALGVRASRSPTTARRSIRSSVPLRCSRHVTTLTTDSVMTGTLACRYYSAAKLPHDFLTGDRLSQANQYRLLCEPIDIANYYRPWAADRCAFRNA